MCLRMLYHFFSINMDSPATIPEQKLRDSLEKLRSEIDQLADDDAPTKSKLAKLVNEIEAGIDPAQDLQDQKLSATVKEAIQHFETEHPRATAILNDIMVTLSNMGI